MMTAISFAFALSNMVQTALTGNDDNYDCFSDSYIDCEYNQLVDYAKVSDRDYEIVIPFIEK